MKREEFNQVEHQTSSHRLHRPAQYQREGLHWSRPKRHADANLFRLALQSTMVTGKSLESFLYGVQPGDPLTLLIAGGVMLLAEIAAMYLPARRAVSVNPSIALRAD